MFVEPISGLDQLRYEVRVTDTVTGAPVTTGTVSMRLCQFNTTTPLTEDGKSEVSLAHEGNGFWAAVHNATDVAAAVAGVAINALFDRVAIVSGRAARRVARCRRVRVVAES